MSSPALGVFERLLARVEDVRGAADREDATGALTTASVLRRACIVLAVAAVDTYFHERGSALLRASAASGQPGVQAVVSYLGNITPAHVTGPSAEGYIRYRLSYKTLVAPDRIDDLLQSCGLVSADVWLQVAVALGSRPERLKMLTQVQFDRRNQIAHEGDWDFIAVDFRPINSAHVGDCLGHVAPFVRAMDSVLP